MSDCPHCRTKDEVLRTVHESEQKLRGQVVALNNALAAADRRETALKAKIKKQQAKDNEAAIIYACLAVWEEHCWAGKRKPSLPITGTRAGRVRKALGWDDITQADVEDAFRGLGLLPYRNKYNERSAHPKPGFTRQADVLEALRDEARLERFRDYYRRVQATPADRLREQWEDVRLVADQLLSAVIRANGRQERESQQEDARERGHLFLIEGDKDREAA